MFSDPSAAASDLLKLKLHVTNHLVDVELDVDSIDELWIVYKLRDIKQLLISYTARPFKIHRSRDPSLLLSSMGPVPLLAELILLLADVVDRRTRHLLPSEERRPRLVSPRGETGDYCVRMVFHVISFGLVLTPAIITKEIDLGNQ